MNDSIYNTLGRNPHQIIRDGSFATKKQFIHNQLFHHHIVQHNIVIQGLLKKLHASLIHEKVPDFYGYFFMGQLTLCSQQRISDCVNRQIQLLKGRKSHFHIIMKHIEIRQNCLKSINQCLESLFDQVKPALLNKFGEQIKHLRKLTVWVIQNIKQWKNSLIFMSPNVFQDQHISFFYHGQDYLLKILKDTDFIAKSFLSEKVNFSYKQDPFLMRPCTNDTQDNEFSALFKFSPQEQHNYITCLQFLADERADYIKRKIMAKTDKIKQIERVYQARQLNQKILITKPNPIALRKAKLSINEAPIDFIDEPSKEQQIKRAYRSNSLSSLRDSKARQLQVKEEKIKKIKEMEIGSSSPLINIKKFNSLHNTNVNPLPINRSISLSFLKKMSSKNEKLEKQKQIQTDFQSMVRKKQLQVLENDSTKRRTLSSIKLKDRLSQRKLVDNKEGAQQLRKILDQIQHSSPQKQQNFLARRETPSRTGRSLLQQNQEIMINLRQSILKEIADDTVIRQKAEQQKRQQNLIMQKLIKTKLDHQTLVNIQKEKAKWTLGKDALAHQINKKQLFDLHQPVPNKSQKLNQLEQELKRQMQLKFLREVHEELSHRQAVYKHQKQRKKQQKQRQKQLETVIRKQQQQNRFIEIEQEERGRAMQKVFQQQQRKKKQIESEMQAVIQKQQERLIVFSNEQKMKLEAQLRQNMKQKLLINLKKQKSVIASEREAQEKQKLLQQAHRAEIRKKMEQQFQVEKNMQRQRQREEKARKLRLVAQKMNHLSQQQQQSMLIRQQSVKQQKIEQLKQNITNFPIPSKGQQQNKRKLREQFELELFAFNRPQMFNKHEDNLVIKDFKAQIDNQQNLNKKFSEASQIITQKEKSEMIIKESSLKASKIEQSLISDNFVRFSQADKQSVKQQIEFNQQQIQAMGIDMTPAEYTIYLKKKQAINAKRIAPKPVVNMDKIRYMLDRFQKMSNLDSEKPQSLIIERQISEKPASINIKPLVNVQKKDEVDQSPKKFPKKQRQQESDDLSQVMKLTVHSKMGTIHKKKFVTSDEEDELQSRKRKKNGSPRKSSNKKKVRQSSSEQEQKFEKSIQKLQTAYFKNVLWQDMDNYLTTHIKKMPKVLRRLNLLRKDELLKSLEDYKNVMIVEVGNPQQPQGIVFIVQNENKQNIRSLNVIYFGAYKTDDTLNVLIKTRDLVFNSDPCSQITFSMYYNKADEQQQTFIRQFEKQFDPYGAIFQKKISNDQTERKHILRRMIGQSSKPLAKNKAIGQLKIQQSFISHPAQLSVGVQLGLESTGSKIGGWTLLGLFLSEFGKQQQIVEELTSDVVEQSKNMKLLSKMAMKLKNNRYADIQFEKFQSPFQANVKFVQTGAQLIKCDPKVQQDPIPITVMKSTIALTPVLPFLSTTSNFHYKEKQRTGKFLRFRCGKGSKVLKLKSSLYSSVFTVIPCKPNNYKILLTDALQFDAISKKTSLDLYIKLFLANITQHSQSNEQQIWIPQFTAQGNYQPEYARNFGFSSQIRNKVDVSFTEYVPNCIKFQPTHRDMFITPPFILAVLNSDIEKSSEGSPIYLQRIDLQDLFGVSDVPIPPPQSDF